MSILLKNKFGKFLFLAAIAAGLYGRAWAAISTINVSLGTSTIATAGQVTDIWLIFDTTSYAPGTITLELLNGGNVVSGGVTPSSVQVPFSGGVGGTPEYSPIKSAQITLYYAKATGLQLRASLVGSNVTGTSSVVVIPDAPSKLLVLAPGMHAPVSPADNPGLPTGQDPNAPFPFTVRLTDAYYNLIATANNALTFSPETYLNLTNAPSTLTNGVASATATITSPKVSVRIAATAASVTGFTDIGSNGPPENEVFAYPSPINPKLNQKIIFQYRSTSNDNATVKVTDQFGQMVWKSSTWNTTPPPDTLCSTCKWLNWDGKNDKGEIVAAGVYYVLLDIGGSIKSKKRFGVVK